MGLKNFMFDGAYAKISKLFYHKDIKQITCHLEVYSKDMSQFFYKDMHISASRKVTSIKIENIPPENPQNGDTYLLQDDLQGVWENYPKHIASWDSFRKDWNYWLAINWPDILFLEDTQEYIKIINGQIVKCKCYDDERLWNKFFSSELLDNSNHVKQFYLYLKSLDEFKDCEDV